MMKIFSSFLMGTTILFGICAQMLLLDFRLNSLKNPRRIFFVVSNLLVLTVNLFLSLILPADQHMKLYVLLIHMPIFLIFWITTKMSAVKVVFALFTAVFMIYPANVVLTLISRTADRLYPISFCVIYIAVCLLMLFVIDCFFKTNFHYLIKNYGGFSFIKLCLLPLLYYISNYWIGMYHYVTAMSGEVVSLRIFLFIITLIAYVLIFDIAKSAREKEALQGVKMALSLMLENADQQLSALKATQEQAAVYRHDMRHHLALIGGYLVDGNVEKAKEYIQRVQADIKVITPNRYCQNNTVNLILSFFAAKAEESEVRFSVDAQLPQTLSVSETEICALLSNGLENAIEAAIQVAEEQFRRVRISCQTHKGNLLIFIENGFTGEVVMENGLPQSSREGHGFGIKSMVMIAERYNGYCSFEAKGEIFIMRAVLPLQ